MTILNYLPLNQKGIKFYVSVSDVKNIIYRINVNRRTVNPEGTQFDFLNIEDNINEINEKMSQGLQRDLMKDKVGEISSYLSKEFGLIPNSIILNIADPLNLVTFEDNLIIIPDDESILITALDGQHRVEGLKKYFETNEDQFQIPLTIFHNAELEFQAYLFSIINSKQTKINKSFLYDLISLSRTQIDEFKLSHEIAYWLNSSPNSELRNNFKLLGKGEGWLSQAAFIDYLIPNVFISEKKDSSNVIFKRYIKRKEYNEIAKFINEYFKAIMSVYSKDLFYSKEYIFRTSFTFGLFMRLMPYAFIYSLDLTSFSYDLSKIIEIFTWIKSEDVDFKKGGVNSGTGSFGKQKQLLNHLIDIIQTRTDINDKIQRFRAINKKV